MSFESTVWARVALAVATAICIPAQGATSVPDWVKTAAQQVLPHYSERTRAVVLLDETVYTVGTDGRATEHVRKVVKILRPQGRQYGYPFVSFDKDSKITSFHVWSIDPAGHEFALKDSEMFEVGSGTGGGELYSDEKAKVADPPGRDPGGVIAYEYERKERPYLAETTSQFQDEIPRVSQNFTLILPVGFTYTTTWAHHPQEKAIDLEHQRYRWEQNNVPAIDLEEVSMSPSYGALAARMTVHYTGGGSSVPQQGTWQGIGEWYEGLARDRTVTTPEITAKSAELTRGKTDFYDKAEAIGEFTQKQIRYFVIEMGIGGLQPHPAADIFNGR